MPETPAVAVHSALRNIPSVERILSSSAFSPLIDEFGRERVKEGVVGHLGDLRVSKNAFDESLAVIAVRDSLTAATGSTLRRVINGSGVIIHTNLGRSPIDPELWSEALEIVSGYS